MFSTGSGAGGQMNRPSSSSTPTSTPTPTNEWVYKRPADQNKDWAEYIEHPKFPSLIAQTSGFFLHPGDPCFDFNDYPEDHTWPLMNASEYEHAYKRNFFGKEHENFISSIEDQMLGPVVVSVEKPSALRTNLRALIQSKRGAERILLPMATVESAGTTIKALYQIKPEFAKLKFIRTGNKIEKALALYEEQIVRNVYKFGVLFCRAGQNTEDEMYNNEHGSAAFEEFLDWIGERVALQGFTGYKGGLDVRENTTGTHSVYTKHHDGCEIMFHVSTLLRFFPLDPQQVERKRHLGNDVILIVFREGENAPFDMSSVHSQFNHVFFVITLDTESETPRYRLEIGAKEGVVTFAPPLPSVPAYINRDEKGRQWLLSKFINAERAAFFAPAFDVKFRDARKQQLKMMIENAKTDIPKKAPGSGIKKSFLGMKTKLTGSQQELPADFFSSPTNFNHVAHLDNGTYNTTGINFVDLFGPEATFFVFDKAAPTNTAPKPPQLAPAPKPPISEGSAVRFSKSTEMEDIDEDDDESRLADTLSTPQAMRQAKKTNTWSSIDKGSLQRPTMSADLFRPPTLDLASHTPTISNSRSQTMSHSSLSASSVMLPSPDRERDREEPAVASPNSYSRGVSAPDVSAIAHHHLSASSPTLSNRPLNNSVSQPRRKAPPRPDPPRVAPPPIPKRRSPAAPSNRASAPGPLLISPSGGHHLDPSSLPPPPLPPSASSDSLLAPAGYNEEDQLSPRGDLEGYNNTNGDLLHTQSSPNLAMSGTAPPRPTRGPPRMTSGLRGTKRLPAMPPPSAATTTDGGESSSS